MEANTSKTMKTETTPPKGDVYTIEGRGEPFPSLSIATMIASHRISEVRHGLTIYKNGEPYRYLRY